ncbi:Lrp/AsnC family transcriptional regulator [Pseudohalocynthiibacter aestuariivivens]|nr:Lrp/AsnC family transcriptional regulator [Pseudohalocynthiibacter aestuariivivens]QIE45206.1 Lrp/AsnC family transcriptional regulator [Pseudohalocynthiibacter aestuariivivens]
MSDIVNSPNSSRGATESSLLSSLPLSDIDREIIGHLQQNGRRTYVAIANDIGVTEKTVRAHAKALLDQKIIQVVALTSPAALGYRVSTLAAISIASPAEGTRISDALARIDSIDYVVLTYSRFAIFAEIIARDMQELQETIETQIGAIEGITGVELFPYFSLHYQQAQIINPNPTHKEGVIDAEMSEADQAIVAELALDGRAAYSMVAEKLGISESQVRIRAQHLLANRQLKIMAIVNPLKLLDCTMSWIAINVAVDVPMSDVADALSSMPNISYVATCAGRFDIFVEVICTSNAELLEIIESQIRPVRGVTRTEAFIYANLHYKRLLPLHVRDRTAAENATVHSVLRN